MLAQEYMPALLGGLEVSEGQTDRLQQLLTVAPRRCGDLANDATLTLSSTASPCPTQMDAMTSSCPGDEAQLLLAPPRGWWTL